MDGRGRHPLLREAIVPTRLWQSKQFLALPVVVQHLYLAVRTQRTVSPAGTIAVDLPGWAALTPSGTPAQVQSALAVLHQRHFLVWDSAAAEIYIRGWLRDVSDVIETTAGIQRLGLAVREIASATIRGWILDEGSALWQQLQPGARKRELGAILSWLISNLGVGHAAQEALLGIAEGLPDTTPGRATGSGPDALPLEASSDELRVDVSQARQPVDGSVMIAAWVDGYGRTHTEPPPKERIARFGAAARQTLKTGGYTDDQYLEAARHAGRRDWLDITASLGQQTSRVESTVSFTNSDHAAIESSDGADIYGGAR